jgi:dephospho-CoA kinase
MLLDLGATVVLDADRTVHDLLRGDSAVRAAVVEHFGETVLAADGSIDRRRLGNIVFADPAALRVLEAILHPAVRRRIREQLEALPAEAIAVVDAVKLLEGELGALAASVWWVTAGPEQQLERLMRRGLSERDAEARLAVQPRLADWCDRVNVVIDNSGSLAHTRYQVETAWKDVLAAHSHPGGGR